MTPLHRNGFSLIEVLVSVFVLAVGIIGSAGMQLGALRTSQQTAFQTAALAFASEMADKMRSHPHQWQLPDQINPFLNVDFQATHDMSDSASDRQCYASDCAADALAQFDIEEWTARIKGALPGARVKICRDAQPWDTQLDSFTWNCSVPVSSQKNAPLVIKIGWLRKGRLPDGRPNAGTVTDFSPSLALAVAPYIQ